MLIPFKRKIDLVTFQLKLQFYELSENELRLLALLYLGGVNQDTKKIALENNVFKSEQSIENHISKFRKLGIIKDEKVILKEPLAKVVNNKATINIELCIQP